MLGIGSVLYDWWVLRYRGTLTSHGLRMAFDALGRLGSATKLPLPLGWLPEEASWQ